MTELVEYDKAETFMVLKYGSVANAYKSWQIMTYKEQCDAFNKLEYEVLMEYEYNMHTNGPGPYEPR